jgi:hypothetical protein
MWMALESRLGFANDIRWFLGSRVPIRAVGLVIRWVMVVGDVGMEVLLSVSNVLRETMPPPGCRKRCGNC